jgi:uncharacterized phage protein gp47/JayE
VLEPGDVRAAPGDLGTVAANHVEVYYEGSTSLQTQVDTQVEAARVAGQNVLVDDATAVTVIVDLQVFCLAGVDHTALTAAVKAALLSVVNAVGVNATVRASEVVKAVHDVPDVVSVNVPFTDLRKSTATDNTFGDISCGNVAYPSLTEANIAVTVTDL